MANIPISAFTAAADTTGIGMSGFSLTGSNAQSMLDLAGTWNTSGTPTGIKLNVTDTASNAASRLMDLQVGGVSRFSVSKGSIAVLGNPASFANGVGLGTSAVNVGDGASVTSTFAGGQVNVWNSNVNVSSLNPGGVGLRSTGSVAWGSGASVGSPDTFLARDAANTLAQRNGTNAQAFRVYNTFTDASNYERGVLAWIGNDLKIGTETAGTGSGARQTHIYGGGQIRLYIFNTLRWLVDSSGNFSAGTDNTYDIGASGSSRPRFLYLGGGSLTGSQANSSLSISPTWNTTGTPTAIDLNVTDTASNNASLLMNLRVGGTSRFNVTKAGNITIPDGNFIRTNGANANNGIRIGGGGFNEAALSTEWVNSASVAFSTGRFLGGNSWLAINSTAVFGWGNGTNLGTGAPSLDTILTRDAANTLAQRNGVNAQAFNIYNTYTDASNYERGFVKWVANRLYLGTEAAGTGTDREIHFITGGTTRWKVLSTGNFSAGTDDTYSIGANSSDRPRNINMTGYTQMQEDAAPAAPAANNVRIYAEDNGSGKTRLMALFATGAAQQIAIEP